MQDLHFYWVNVAVEAAGYTVSEEIAKKGLKEGLREKWSTWPRNGWETHTHFLQLVTVLIYKKKTLHLAHWNSSQYVNFTLISKTLFCMGRGTGCPLPAPLATSVHGEGTPYGPPHTPQSRRFRRLNILAPPALRQFSAPPLPKVCSRSCTSINK
jgi:hypothetical protein